MENLNSLVEQVKNKKGDLGLYYDFVLLLVEHGLRVSELLKINASAINERAMIKVIGSKNSNNRVISSGESALFWLRFRGLNISVGSVISRYQMHRLLKKIGISETKEGNKNASTTSLGRNYFVKELQDFDLTQQEIANNVGHKSLRSQKYYGRKTR